MPAFRPVAQRFWGKVRKTDGCWFWIGSAQRRKTGRFAGIVRYGMFHVDGRTELAHRVSYELAFGPIPQDKNVCHACDITLCVRPKHLFLGTQLENAADMKRKKRSAVGEKNGMIKHPESRLRGEKSLTAKLTNSQVLEVVRLGRRGMSHRQIGKRFEVSFFTIGQILRGRTWSWLTGISFAPKLLKLEKS